MIRVTYAFLFILTFSMSVLSQPFWIFNSYEYTNPNTLKQDIVNINKNEFVGLWQSRAYIGVSGLIDNFEELKKYKVSALPFELIQWNNNVLINGLKYLDNKGNLYSSVFPNSLQLSVGGSRERFIISKDIDTYVITFGSKLYWAWKIDTPLSASFNFYNKWYYTDKMNFNNFDVSIDACIGPKGFWNHYFHLGYQKNIENTIRGDEANIMADLLYYFDRNIKKSNLMLSLGVKCSFINSNLYLIDSSETDNTIVNRYPIGGYVSLEYTVPIFLSTVRLFIYPEIILVSNKQMKIPDKSQPGFIGGIYLNLPFAYKLFNFEPK